MNDPTPDELLLRLEQEFLRVGTGPSALAEVGRRVAGPQVRASGLQMNGFSANIGFVRLILNVLESLPDQAGPVPFVDAVVAAMGKRPGTDAGA